MTREADRRCNRMSVTGSCKTHVTAMAAREAVEANGVMEAVELLSGGGGELLCLRVCMSVVCGCRRQRGAEVEQRGGGAGASQRWPRGGGGGGGRKPAVSTLRRFPRLFSFCEDEAKVFMDVHYGRREALWLSRGAATRIPYISWITTMLRGDVRMMSASRK